MQWNKMFSGGSNNIQVQNSTSFDIKISGVLKSILAPTCFEETFEHLKSPVVAGGKNTRRAC